MMVETSIIHFAVVKERVSDGWRVKLNFQIPVENSAGAQKRVYISPTYESESVADECMSGARAAAVTLGNTGPAVTESDLEGAQEKRVELGVPATPPQMINVKEKLQLKITHLKNAAEEFERSQVIVLRCVYAMSHSLKMSPFFKMFFEHMDYKPYNSYRDCLFDNASETCDGPGQKFCEMSLRGLVHHRFHVHYKEQKGKGMSPSELQMWERVDTKKLNLRSRQVELSVLGYHIDEQLWYMALRSDRRLPDVVGVQELGRSLLQD